MLGCCQSEEAGRQDAQLAGLQRARPWRGVYYLDEGGDPVDLLGLGGVGADDGLAAVIQALAPSAPRHLAHLAAAQQVGGQAHVGLPAQITLPIAALFWASSVAPHHCSMGPAAQAASAPDDDARGGQVHAGGQRGRGGQHAQRARPERALHDALLLGRQVCAWACTGVVTYIGSLTDE